MHALLLGAAQRAQNAGQQLRPALWKVRLQLAAQRHAQLGADEGRRLHHRLQHVCPHHGLVFGAQLLLLFSRLGGCCRGGPEPGSLAEGLASSVAVVQAALAARVPSAGLRGEGEGAPHAARWAAYEVLAAVCALPDAAGARAVFSARGLGTLLLADGGEGSLAGRARAQAVVAAALENPAVEQLGELLGAQLRASAAAARGGGGGRRAAVEPGVLVAERGSM